MITAYVLLRIKPGRDKNVLNNIQKLPQVKFAESVYGEYDMLLKVEVENLDELDSFIFDAVRTMKGVEGSTTLIALKISGEQNARG